MSKASLELGGGNWGTKDGNLLAYAQGNESSNLVPREFTFTRGSDIAATKINSSGLIEKYRENLLLHSNAFNNWTNSNTTETSGQIGYDGSSDAWLLEKSLASGFIFRSFSGSGVYTLSLYAKAGTLNSVLLLILASGGNGDAYFNLSTGVVDQFGNNAFDAQIEDVGGGWYRCSLIGNYTSISQVRIYPANNQGIADTSGTIYIQDAQVEQGLVATSYLESGATKATSGVADNEPRINYAGGTASLLLEPSRTNLIEYSEYFEGSIWETVNLNVKNNNAISPEGVQNAAKICETTATNTRFRLRTNSSRTTSGDNVLSIYAKAEERTWIVLREQSQTGVYAFFNLSGNGSVGESTADNPTIEPLSDGWYKCSITDVLTAVGMDIRIALSDGVDSYDGVFGNGLYVYGAQIEQGSYPTSYIPTYGTSVTRSFDYSIVESLGYSSTCTFYYEFNTTTGREASSPFAEVGKDTSNKFYIKGASTNNPQFQIQGNGIFSGSISPTNEISGINKIAVQWSSGVGVVFCNGVKQSGTLANSNTSENIDFIAIKGEGTLHDSKKLLFFPTALTDRELVDLTSPYSTYQELVTAEGLTWESPTCTTNSITELQSI